MNRSRTETYHLSRQKRKKRLIRNLMIVASLVLLLVCGTVVMKLTNGVDSTPPDRTANDGGHEDVRPDPINKPADNKTPPAEPNKPSPEQPGSKETISLSFVGDVLLGSTVETLLKSKGYDYPYTYVRSYLEKPEVTVANMETPVTVRGEAQQKEYVYKSSPEALPEFVKAGFDIVNLANNHSMDQGVEGLLDTFDHLERAGVKKVGAGRNMDEAFSPIIVEKSGIKTAFLGFSRVVPYVSWYAGKNKPGVAGTYDYRRAVEAIKAAESSADLVIVIAHWGEERKDNPNKEQVELAHRYIDAGADLVVGGHPHVLQGFEHYKGKWIAYSLGNFIFTTNENEATLQSAILEAACIKEQTCDLQLVPIYTKWAQPVVMAAEQGGALMDRLSKLSVNAEVGKDGKITAKND